MRYSILGFSQERLIQIQTDNIKLDMTDILLMDYIQKALSQPSMYKIMRDNQPYVWLKHTKILEDLPILDIKENMLRKRLTKLIQLNLIKCENIANGNNRGSKAYYTITETFESLQYEETTSRKKLQVVEEPPVKNYSSYNKLVNTDNQVFISKDINTKENPEFEFGKTKKPKQSLYSKCVSLIDDFTDDATLRGYLLQFLQLCLDNAKESGKPFYTNNFKGKLNRLQSLSNDYSVQTSIVRQSVENGWSGFYEVKENRGNKKGNAVTDIEQLDPTVMTHATAEQKKKFKEDIASGRAEKF